MAENEKKVKDSEIDEETKAELRERIDLGISDEKEMNRTELNFLAELLGVIKGMKAEIHELQQVISVLSHDKMNAYFKEIADNAHAEEVRRKVQEKIAQSHKKAKKVDKA